MRKLTGFFAIALMALASVGSADEVFNVDVNGIESWDLVGAPDNIIMTIEVGQETELIGASWDVGIDPIGASWYSETAVVIGGGAVTLAPGIADGVATDGGPRFYESGGLASFADAGIPNIVLTDSNGDGSNDFTIEFVETFDDVAFDIDGFWLNGMSGTNPSGLGGLDFQTIGPGGPGGGFVPPASFTTFRGISVSSANSDFADSDDVAAMFNPGFTISNAEAPVWLIFDATAADATDFLVESSAGTPGLTYTAEAFNWLTSSYDEIGVAAEAFSVDVVMTYPIVAADHIDTNGEVRGRVGWRRTGFTINFPWEVRVDQVGWNQ